MTTLLILGFTLKSDGTISETLANRLDSAIQEMNQQNFDRIIVSGGKPADAEENFPTQASIMFTYLSNHVVPNKTIIQDPNSHNC